MFIHNHILSKVYTHIHTHVHILRNKCFLAIWGSKTRKIVQPMCFLAQHVTNAHYPPCPHIWFERNMDHKQLNVCFVFVFFTRVKYNQQNEIRTKDPQLN